MGDWQRSSVKTTTRSTHVRAMDFKQRSHTVTRSWCCNTPFWRHASQRMGLVAASSVIHKQWRTLLRRAKNHRQQTLIYASQRLCLSDRCNDTCGSEHVLFWIIFNTRCRYKTSHNKLFNWHADSSRRSIVQLSRERVTPRDLEPNLSQTLHLV